MSLNRLKAGLARDNFSYKDLRDAYAEIEARLYDELTLVDLFCISGEQIKYFEPGGPLFGAAVADKFPSANYDIEEAGKCCRPSEDIPQASLI